MKIETNIYWLAKYLNDYILQREKQQLQRQIDKQKHIKEQIAMCPPPESIQMYLLNRHVLENDSLHHIHHCQICKKRLEFADYVHAQFHLLGMTKHLGLEQTKACFTKLDPYFREYLLEKHQKQTAMKSSLNFKKAPHHLKTVLSKKKI
ncbi:hypothetical protein [Candidatus Uabimicrobium amorphum]|uniref:Uncharacterized protein n=1 Tax=Uabimicrobium amorphum TaxID=2596890 RepID=A0A5S9IXB4_UABAM|nr:hypothetical protein [Candidatus Uabimicrobium amorphum]BBM88245.1 hypothetical protein UABAM_06666 [Candidatus Uabimicrobium amorphum]